MEALRAQERVLEQHVHQLLQDNDQPIGNVLQAFEAYRAVCQDVLLMDLARAAETEIRLWQAHTAGKAYFHTALSGLRKRGNEVVVQTRGLTKLYLNFLKDSERFYRGYIYRLHTQFGGIAELEAVAQRMSSSGGDAKSGESLGHHISPELRTQALVSCHRSLIYLGDLSRYRASDKLDKSPDFGRAIGYYELACTLRPTSGLGHHQQAVVALTQARRNELRAIYHLYRALVVDEPHELAAKNLESQLEKANRAWSKGESLQQGATNDVEGAKRLVIGWFVRMHSLCFKGDKSPAYVELEQTLLRQLSEVIKNVAINVEKMLFRMVMINMAAQHHAGEMVQKDSAIRYQQAFFYFFRLNIRFYTTLLDLLHDSIHPVSSTEIHKDDLAARLTPIICRVLPSLRLYSAWLLANLHMINGLTNDEFLHDAVTSLWQSYTRVLNKVADKDFFGVWGLEDYEAVYMLNEDCDTIGFKPLQNPQQQSWKNWLLKDGQSLKPRSSDVNVTLMSSNHEMLARVKDLLDDGMYLCHEEKNAPISLLGVTVYYGNPPEEAVRAAEEAKKHPPKAFPKPKPLSYAMAASNAPTQQAVKAPKTIHAASVSANTRTAQLTRMVDELVDDEDYDNPVTPPQQHVSNPAVVPVGELNIDSMNNVPYKAHQDLAPVQSDRPKQNPGATGPHASRHTHLIASPALGTPRENLARSSDRLRSESVSGLWHDTPTLSSSPNFPPGLSTGTLTSPTHMRHHGHSRVNSASSIRSRTSAQNGRYGDTWTSIDSLPQPVQALHVPALAREGPVEGYTKFGVSGMASPFLFGAGGGMWSATGGSFQDVMPPNGQGGQEKP